METEQVNGLNSKLRLTNILLTMLVTMVAGFFLQQGVSGLLWLVCWVVTLYGLGTLGFMVVALTTAGLAYLVNAVAAYSKLNSEEARMQVLNDIYNRVNNKNKQ